MGAREELAAVLHEVMCCPDAEPEAVETFLEDAAAILASDVLARLLDEARAEAWDEGYQAADFAVHRGIANPCAALDRGNPYRADRIGGDS